MMRQTLISAPFLLLHLAAVLLAGRALLWAFQTRVSLQVMLGPWMPVAVGLMVTVVVLSSIELTKTVQRWWRREELPDWGIRVRGLVYAALIYLLIEIFVLQTERDNFVWLGLFVAYTLYVGWTRLLPRLRKRTGPRFRRGLDLLCMNIGLTLVLAEVALRLTAIVWPTPLLVTSASSQQTRLAASRLTPFSQHYGSPVNSTGHNDQEFVPRSSDPQEPLVVSIGDSFSVARVPHTFHFTTVCEQELPDVAVYNMGISMIGPAEYRYLLEHEALPLHPDLVLINLFIGNDLTDGGFYQGPPRWHDAESYLLPVVLQRIQAVGREQNYLEQLDRDSRRSVESIQSRPVEQVRAEFVAAAPELADPLLEQPTFRRNLYLQIERDRAEAVCGTSSYDEFFHRLRELTRVSGIPLAFVLIPDEFQVEDPLWDEIVEQSDHPLDRDRPQREIATWLEAQGYDYLDLLPVLRSVAPLPDGLRHVYHLQDTHFNVRGNEIAGRAIAEFVKPKLAQDTVLRQQFRQLPIEIRLDDPAVHRWMLRGWYRNRHADPGAGCWSDGGPSELLLPLPTDADLTMTLECLPLAFPDSPPQTVAVFLNGQSLATVSLREGLHSYDVVVPQSKLRDYQNHFAFHYSLARRPSEVLPPSEDDRSVSVCWHAIRFTKRDTPSGNDRGDAEVSMSNDVPTGPVR